MTIPLKTLILADSASHVARITRQLQRAGYAPVYQRASTARSMASALAQRQWDVILADNSLPALNALAALALLRQTQLDLPFIIVSNTPEEALAVEALTTGAHDFISRDDLARLAPAIAREMRAAAGRRLHRQVDTWLQQAQAHHHPRAQAGEPDLARAQAQLPASVTQAQQLADGAQAANRAKSAFLSCVSHELRTPLTSILCGLSLVLDSRLESPAQHRDLIQNAYTAGQRLQVVINQMLDMATLERGQMKAHPQAIVLSPLLREVTGLVRPLAKKKGIRLRWHAAHSETKVQADPELVRQILENLVVNAVKFTEAGQVTVRVRLAGDQMELMVADTGIGIAAEIQAKLFQPFVQGDNSLTRRYGGVGLGLSLSRHLAELMGGRLLLHSAGAGQGSTFSLTLPLATSSAGTD